MNLTLEMVLKEWEVDALIDNDSLDTSSIEHGRLHSKYLQIHSAVRVRLNKKKKELELLLADKKQWAQGRMTKEEMDEREWKYDPFDGFPKPLKGELDNWLKTDKDILNLRSKIDELELLSDTTKEILESVKWRHQSIKNAIEFKKFQAGA